MRHADNHRDDNADISPLGEQQVETIGRKLAETFPTSETAPVLIVSSSLLRAQQTSIKLRDLFNSKNIQCKSIFLDELASPDDNLTLNLYFLLQQLDTPLEGVEFPPPKTVIVICHKGNSLMTLMHTIIDPNSIMEVAEEDRKTSAELKELEANAHAMTDEDLHRFFGKDMTDETDTPDFIETRCFKLNTPWSGFDLNCGRYVTQLVAT